METAYHDYVMSIFRAVKDEINGKVRYTAYPDMDFVIFRVLFKGFNYEYAVNNISEKMQNGDKVESIAKTMKEEYKKTILSAFFRK